ncbi:glycoside hydrolase family 10 protein [Moheibacter lacus]|uniref:Family 10 glycosylhydrolase n=1 Tax=Moheibacter lacus TaxID=2745851 RepID=A0A838ZU22_9FLAO|nr:family 10 glycosylhydrolase [Moheibacter lacus]MBA5630505.1 family 10 glycosylhydrolase [Moheibacter lacus]
MHLKKIKFLIAVTLLIGTFHSCATKSTQPTVHQRSEVKIPERNQDSNSPSVTTTKENPKETKEEIKTVEEEQVVRKPKKEAEKEKEKIEERIKIALPEVNREFRAAWIATVANINWPSKRGLSTDQQKAEVIHILDQLKENNFNAVIFQARPSADALYDSPYEPWSVFLTGENGQAPSPYYDPLEFWIEECHKRGMELHVWLNPYRAHHTNGGRVASTSMVHQMPSDIVRLANGMYWFDPAKKTTQDHASQVVKDIVKRYDIDGIHFDDYFYPYASYNNGKDFPDNDSWNEYLRNGGDLSRADWRRENVNQFIKRIYEEIKSEKNWVKFGISPFGIWKSGVPYGVSGLSQYDELYADAKLWLNEGWIDYFTPQLYWPVDAPRQNFSSLLQWWESENTHNRHLWPGLNTVEIKTSDKPTEIVRQIELTRQLVPNSAGVAHWSYAGLNSNMLYKLKAGPYKEKALVPKSPWLKPLISERPDLFLADQQNNIQVNWSLKKEENVSHWLLYKRYGETWETEILDSKTTVQTLQKHKNGKRLDMIVIQAVDRLGNESEYEAKIVS